MTFRSVLDERSDLWLPVDGGYPQLRGNTAIRLTWRDVVRFLDRERWRLPLELLQPGVFGAVAVVLAVAQLGLWADDTTRAKWHPEPERGWGDDAMFDAR